MADNAARVARLRYLAIIQLIVGLLLFCAGIAEQFVVDYWLTRSAYFGIWGGILVSRRPPSGYMLTRCTPGIVHV